MKPNAVMAVFGGIAALVLMAWVVSIRMEGKVMPTARDSRTPGIIADLTKATAGSGLPFLAAKMPPFDGVSAWLNSAPLTPERLKGKVVLVDFWTYSCINCIRTLPYVTSWYGKYKDKGLVIVGVHTPEFAFEKSEKNVTGATRRLGIEYPVALDNDYATWNNYENKYWPAKYLFDAEGRLRYTHFGEGDYDVTEGHIQDLLAEAGTEAKVPVTDMPTTTDFSQIGSPEIYIGYERQEFLGSEQRVLRDRPQDYTAAVSPARNLLYLEGKWQVEAERAVLVSAPGDIVFRYLATNANLVLGPGSSGGKKRAIVTVDGAPVPKAMRGADVTDEGGYTMVTIDEERLYSLVDGRGEYEEHTLRIRFLDEGVEAYAFTFG